MTIPLYEDFANPLGEFINYDTYDSAQLTQLARQKHVDIRSFVQDSIVGPYDMYDLDGLTLSGLALLTMETLETSHVIVQGEHWTGLGALLPSVTLYPSTSLYPYIGAVGPQAAYNYFNGILIDATTGANSVQSIADTINISSFAAPDYISLALPAFPLASLTLSSTYLDLSSDPSGSFASGQTDSLPFSSSTTTLIAGDSEARFPVSMLTHVNPASIVAVRLRLQATTSCVFRCLAIRCIAASWEFAPLDQNTLYDRIGATVPPTGTVTPSYSFPTAGAPTTPADWPVLFFSDGASGPALVNISLGAIIQTGSNTAANSFTLYFRELPMLTNTASGLHSQHMSDLDGHRLPDYAPGSLDHFNDSHFLTVTLNWGTVTSILLGDQASTRYTLNSFTLAPQTPYYLYVVLEDNSLRAKLYPIDNSGIVDWSTVVFDSTAVIDTGFIRRRQGRLGWYAHLGEGDTYITTVRPRRTIYGEYWSAPLASITPVEGARIYVGSSPDTELYTGAIAIPGTTITPDVTKSTSGHCLQVKCDGTLLLEGLTTNAMRFENLYDTEIEFDVLAPFSASLQAFLLGDNRLILLYVPMFATNRWTHIEIPLELIAQTYLPDEYSLFIIQQQTAPNTWYIDNLSVHSRAVSWEGRGQAADPWNMNNPSFIKFGDAINQPYTGALLGRGNALQIKGQTLTQDAALGDLKILPQYSTLGNFVWSDNAPSYGTAPIPSFTTSTPSSPAHSIHCNASASTASNGILDYYWTFGDGNYAYGETPTHTYTTPGSYLINLTVIDLLDQKTSTTHAVTIL